MKKIYPKTCIALDIETTDLSPERGKVIEIAAVKFKNGEIIDKFQSLINPQEEIPILISSITGITNEKVKNSPKLSEIKDILHAFIGNYPIVGHNINFDINFLNAKGFNLKNRRYDTWKFATLLIPELSSHSLESLTNYLKIKHIESHRALDDVMASIDLFLYLVQRTYAIDSLILKEIHKFLDKKNWSLADIFHYVYKNKPGEKKKEIISRVPKIKSRLPKKISIDFEKIEQIFIKKEKAKKIIRNYEFRPGQIELMKLLLKNFQGENSQIIGAGPGVGKYLAYLVPAIYFARKNTKKSGILFYSLGPAQKVLNKEMETARKIIPFDFSAGLLEKRERYICLRRFNIIKNKNNLKEKQINSLVKLLLWLPDADLGIFSEAAWIYEDYEIEEKINCAEKYCLKDKCPLFNDCFYYKALYKAKNSDIVLFTYGSFFFPSFSQDELKINNIIADESHKIEKFIEKSQRKDINEKIIISKLSYLDHDPGFLPMVLSTPKLNKKIKNKAATIIESVSKLKNQTSLFFGITGIFLDKYLKESNKKYIYNLPLDEVREYSGWDRVEKSGNNFIAKINNALFDLNILIKMLKQKIFKELKYDLAGIHTELFELANDLKKTIISSGPGQNIWLTSINNQIIFSFSHLPTDIILNKSIEEIKSANFISSALELKEEFDYLKANLGLSNFSSSLIKSPFRYEKQVKIFIPNDISSPSSPGFNKEAESLIKNIAEIHKGRIIVSFGSRSAIKRVYENISIYLKNKNIKVLALGVSGGADKLLQEFSTNPKTIFLTTHEFLEENEIPEKSLKSLIIYKLPFEISRYQTKNSNQFKEDVLPKSLIKFKQIFYKLIRSSKDRGIFIILDNRIKNMEYGEKFIQSLPATNVEYILKQNIPKSSYNWLKKK